MLNTTPIATVAVIFNLVNHASLMAAVLYTLARREFEEVTITLIDIRDWLPTDMDQYVWVGVSGPALYKQYHQATAGQNATPTINRAWCDELVKKSICIDEVDSPQQLSLDTVIGQALVSFPGTIDTSPIKSKYHALFVQFAVLSQSFMKDTIEVDNYCAYYAALDLAHSMYFGEFVELADFQEISQHLSAPLAEFNETQKRMAKTLSHKLHEVWIEGYRVQKITTTGVDVYNLIRRIGLSKKAFVHVSAGSYGPVVYSDDVVLTEKAGFGKEAFLLMPKELSATKHPIVDDAVLLDINESRRSEDVGSTLTPVTPLRNHA